MLGEGGGIYSLDSVLTLVATNVKGNKANGQRRRPLHRPIRVPSAPPVALTATANGRNYSIDENTMSRLLNNGTSIRPGRLGIESRTGTRTGRGCQEPLERLAVGCKRGGGVRGLATPGHGIREKVAIWQSGKLTSWVLHPPATELQVR